MSRPRSGQNWLKLHVKAQIRRRTDELVIAYPRLYGQSTLPKLMVPLVKGTIRFTIAPEKHFECLMQWFCRMKSHIVYNCIERNGGLLPVDSCLSHYKVNHFEQRGLHHPGSALHRLQFPVSDTK